MSAPLEPGLYLQAATYLYQGSVTMPANQAAAASQDLFQGAAASLAAAFPNARATTPVTSKVSVRVKAIAPRIVYMSTHEFMGALVGATAAIKLISKTADVANSVGSTTVSGVDPSMVDAIAIQTNLAVAAQASASAQQQSTATWGLGDIELGPILRWAHDEDQFLFTPAVVLPTGKYSANGATSPGSGDFSSIRLGAQYGHIGDGWDIGTRVGFTANGRNRATGYRSGNYINIDTALMKSWSDSTRVGMAAYGMYQTTRDTSNQAVTGLNVLTVNRKGHVYGIGPSLAWIKGADDAIFDLRLMKEFASEFRPRGAAAWFTAAFVLR